MRGLKVMRGVALAAVTAALVAVPVAAQHNELTDAEREAGWTLLFNGHDLDGWRRYNGEPMTGGWSVEDGMLTHVSGGRDIVTVDAYTDFELSLEWMVAPGGNSGVFYRAALGEEWVYHSAPEMQVLDDAAHRDGQNPLTSAGSNYGLYPAPRGIVKGSEQWNSARIVVRGSSVEHWLNGTKIVAYDFGSPGWSDLVANSKFGEWPAYGQAESGHIGFQDHGDRVWYRNVKLRELR